MTKNITNCVTFDVEDYYQVEALRSLVDFEDWPSHESRVEQNVRKLLDILDAQKTKSTFFVLGWIGERFPEIVRMIHRHGHEIACHGYAHRMISDQTPDEFRHDIRIAKATLEDIIGEKVLGYRAPTFSIMRRTLWALDILGEEGFQYDSSIFPVHHDRYGIPDWNRYIQAVPLRNGTIIIEVPPLTARLLKLNLPVAGGGYFRLAPLWISFWAVRRMNAEGHPAVIYLHPWEFDPAQPRFPIPPLHRFRHYVNLSTTESKLRRLLTMCSFTRLRDILAL